MYEDQVQHIVQHGPCSCTWPACQWSACPGLGSGSGPGFHTSGRVQAGAQMINWELLQTNLFHSLHCSVFSDLIYGNTCSHPFVSEPHSNALNICHLHPCFKPDLPALRNATPLFAKWWENESASTAENQQRAHPQSILLINPKHQMYLQQKRAIQSIPMPRCGPVTAHHTDLSLSLSLCLSLYLSSDLDRPPTAFGAHLLFSDKMGKINIRLFYGFPNQPVCFRPAAPNTGWHQIPQI